MSAINKIMKEFVEASQSGDGETIKKNAGFVSGLDANIFAFGIKNCILNNDKENTYFLVDKLKSRESVYKQDVIHMLIKNKWNGAAKDLVCNGINVDYPYNFPLLLDKAIKHENHEMVEVICKKISDEFDENSSGSKIMQSLEKIAQKMENIKIIGLLSRYLNKNDLHSQMKWLMFNIHGVEIAKEIIKQRTNHKPGFLFDANIMEEAILLNNKNMIDVMFDYVDLDEVKAKMSDTWLFPSDTDGGTDGMIGPGGYLYFLNKCKTKEDKEELTENLNTAKNMLNKKPRIF